MSALTVDYDWPANCTHPAADGDDWPCMEQGWAVDDGGDYGRHGSAVCPKHDTPEGRVAAMGRYLNTDEDIVAEAYERGLL